MIYKNIEITNCTELVEQEDKSVKLYRVPLELDSQIKGSAAIPSGVELRFVPLDDEVTITLKNEDGFHRVNRAVMFYGEFQGGWDTGQRDLLPDGVTELKFKRSNEIDVLNKIAKDNNHSYSPEVIRLRLDGMVTSIVDIKGNCRPPYPDEVPNKKYLAYGSSITHGSEGLVPNNAYVMRTADNLKMENINLGFPGSAMLEPVMANYLASRNDFDVMTLELGINILDIEYEDFRERTEYFIKTIAEAHPDKPIFCIDFVITQQDLWEDDNPQKHCTGFRTIVKEAVEKYGSKNTVYVNGLSLLSDICYLTADITHPSMRAMEIISNNLTEIIKKHIGE